MMCETPQVFSPPDRLEGEVYRREPIEATEEPPLRRHHLSTTEYRGTPPDGHHESHVELARWSLRP